MTKEESGPGTAHCRAKRSAVATESPEEKALAATGREVPSAAMRRLWREIDTAKNRPIGRVKLSRCIVRAGLKITVEGAQTGGAPSAVERYDPESTKTNDAFSCVCKGTSSARNVGAIRDTEKPGSSLCVSLAPKNLP
jgi:hypothetical protein